MERIGIPGAEIAATRAGEGPPVLLLHGFPETRACWRKVIPALSRDFTVVAPDLRGVGDSRATTLDQSKRSLARDAVATMEALGFDRFAVVGHDRGARVAYRLALDAPAKVSKLCVLDIIPTGEMWSVPREQLLRRSPHWPELAERDAEQRLRADPGYLERTLRSWAKDFSALEDAVPEYRRTWDASIAAWCADYQAGATVDDEHDLADQAAGRRILCPVLALWSHRPLFEADPLTVWRRWAHELEGEALSCGHFLPEEAPEQILEKIVPFLRRT